MSLPLNLVLCTPTTSTRQDRQAGRQDRQDRQGIPSRCFGIAQLSAALLIRGLRLPAMSPWGAAASRGAEVGPCPGTYRAAHQELALSQNINSASVSFPNKPQRPLSLSSSAVTNHAGRCWVRINNGSPLRSLPFPAYTANVITAQSG